MYRLVTKCRIFFWVKAPTNDSTSPFNWRRDSIYIATLLLGSGGAMVLVIALSMITFLVQDYRWQIVQKAWGLPPNVQPRHTYYRCSPLQ